MKPYLCTGAVWIFGNLCWFLMIYGIAKGRVGVPRALVWGGLVMSAVVVAVWTVTFAVMLIVADQQDTAATNGELVTSCALWSALPMLLTLVLHVAGLVRAARAPRA